MLLLFKLKRSAGVASCSPLHRITVSAAGGGGGKGASAARASPSPPCQSSQPSRLPYQWMEDGILPGRAFPPPWGQQRSPSSSLRIRHSLSYFWEDHVCVLDVSCRPFDVARRRALRCWKASSHPQTLRLWAVIKDVDPLNICGGGGRKGLGPDCCRCCYRFLDPPCPA